MTGRSHPDWENHHVLHRNRRPARARFMTYSDEAAARAGASSAWEMSLNGMWRRRLVGLALTSVIDQTDVYREALENLIWELCNEYTWSLPAHLPVGVEVIWR